MQFYPTMEYIVLLKLLCPQGYVIVGSSPECPKVTCTRPEGALIGRAHF
jgi:hypothetical protein